MRRLIAGLLVAGVVFGIAYALWSAGPKVPEDAVLVLELAGSLEESPPTDALAQFSASGPALPTILLLLDMAAVDDRIEGVLVHVRTLSVGYARVQELRDALAKVRDAGKTVTVLLDMASLNATRELYFASVANKVYVVPGFLGPLAGIAGQYLYMAGFFEKIGVEWQYARVGEFKSAVETFSAREMSAPARKMMNELLDGIFSQIVEGIAEGRGLSRERVRELIEAAPATAQEYAEAGLADGLADRDNILELAGLGDAEEIDAGTYQRVGPNELGLRDGPSIALIFGNGPIVQSAGPSWRRSFSADEIGDAIESAADDDSIRAIVLRVNSGGGSALASEQLWRVVMRAREKKPVIVSMGDAAASGGYYIASSADAIFAEPATLTGSIGVFLMRPAAEGLYEKLGIRSEVMKRGQHSSIASSDQRMSAGQQQRTDDIVQSIYQDFIGRVSEGRDLETEAVDRVGRGHVWLGETALALNLVDGVGGLSDAVERARVEAGIPDGVDPTRVVLPGPRGPLTQLRQLLSSELQSWLMRSLVPVELPEALTWFWAAKGNEVSYLPPHWIEIY